MPCRYSAKLGSSWSRHCSAAESYDDDEGSFPAVPVPSLVFYWAKFSVEELEPEMAKDQVCHLSPIISGSVVMPDRRHLRSALHMLHEQRSIRTHFLLFFINFAGTRLACQVAPSHMHMCALHYSSLSPSLPPPCLTSLQYPPSTLGLGSCAQPLQENASSCVP